TAGGSPAGPTRRPEREPPARSSPRERASGSPLPVRIPHRAGARPKGRKPIAVGRKSRRPGPGPVMVRPGGAGARPASPAGANLRPDRGSAPGPGDAEAGAPGASAGPAGPLVPGRATAACITSAAASSKPYAGFPGGLRPRTPLREVAMFVYEVMRTPVITLRPDDTVRQAIRVLYGNHITAAPVVGERGELAGMVSEIDLLTAELRAPNTLDRNFPE